MRVHAVRAGVDARDGRGDRLLCGSVNSTGDKRLAQRNPRDGQQLGDGIVECERAGENSKVALDLAVNPFD
jgi:hypothetical protein